MKTVSCGEHGDRAWHGEIVCSRCGRLFKKLSMAPVTCACGTRLRPTDGQLVSDDKPSGDFSARIVCSDCFKINYPRVRMA